MSRSFSLRNALGLLVRTQTSANKLTLVEALGSMQLKPKYWMSNPGTPLIPQSIRAICASLSAHSSSPRDSIQLLETKLDDIQGRVCRLEAVEAAHSGLSRFINFLDALYKDPQMASHTAVAELFTPSAVLDTGKYGAADSLEEIVPLLQKIAKQQPEGSSQCQYTTNVVAQTSRDDPSMVRATACVLIVKPVAGALPIVDSMFNVNAKLEKGLDDKWRIRSIVFVESTGST